MENFQRILSSVFNTALNAAQNTANRAMDPYAVHEISSKADIAEVSEYPVYSRASSLLLYGPVEPGHFYPKKAYDVILHDGISSTAHRMFSLLRTDSLNEAQELFTIYKENFPVLIAIDKAICKARVLDKMARTLRLNKGWSAPHLAAAFGLDKCLRSQALQVGLNCQEQGSLRTPLLVAIEFGVVSSVATLLELGADVTIPDIKNNNVFHVAASQQSLPIIQLLEDKIAHHSSAQLLDSVNVEGFSPLHIAYSHNRSDIVVKSFLNGGASVLIRSESQEFPIHAAVKAQSVTCIQELVTKDPSHLLLPDLQDGRSPLHWAQSLKMENKVCENRSVVEQDLDIKEHVRKAYAQVAIKNSAGEECGIAQSCCGTGTTVDVEYSKNLGYKEDDLKGMVEGANMGLGCGNPSALAALKLGEVVVDLGSGGGFDCFLAARRVGPTGFIIGVDMTPEMITKARLNAQKGGHQNVEFRLGEIEHLPVADNTADVIISNCVLNLSTNKPQVIREASRVLKAGGRLAISDIVATSPLPNAIKNDLQLYSGCLAGATPIQELEESLTAAGFINISIKVNPTSRTFIEKWSYYSSGAENYVASASINAIKPQSV